ncbi:LysE family translocator [Bergeriella denitrificans]|uniref:Homoserine/homoserine lactone efflux protein n=1 Tax=Bergeriella denitrificans TaxID=494 RepID=A0A378UDV0_BERDE|nr:LysE family translocator [Bergeriella denitrificans]STZ75495.1 Homoserine/homoserine lactone efflux protein [Bergeriella denitrificans]
MMNDWFAYTMICLVLVLSPGPNTFLIFSTATGAGRRDALIKIAGLVAATYVHGLLSLFGVSLILLQSPTAFWLVKTTGALYLFYLGAKFAYQAWNMTKTADLQRTASNKLSFAANFRTGFTTQILNPKVSMFYVAAFPQFINFKGSYPYAQGVLLISIHAFTIAAWFVLMTVCIDKFARYKSNLVFSKIALYCSAAFLMYFAGVFILQPLPTLG